MKKTLLFFYFAFIIGQSFAQNWQFVGNGLPSHFANANNEALEFGGSMYVVGYVFNGTFGVPTAYTPKVFKLTAGTWTEVGTGFASTQYAGSFNINAIAEYNSELYIAGDFVMDNGTDAAFNDVAKWDNVNNRWVPVGDGTGDGIVNELTVYNSKLYAGGRFTDLGAAGTNNIAVYDGTSWAAVGTGISVAANGADDDDQVKVMTIYGGNLIVAGKFSTAGAVLAHNIAQWDGSSWTYLLGQTIDGGGGVGGFNNGQVYVMALQVFGTDLFVGGTFTSYYNLSYIGSSTAVPNHLAVWDGSFFSAPTKATPANIRVNAMTVFNSRIYIGNANENKIYSWDGSIFNWELAPDRDPIRQRVENFYSNATDIYYVQNYGVYRLTDPIPSFNVSDVTPCEGQSVTYTDTSTGSNTITGWNWTFPGGTPASSTAQNPVVVYNTKGSYSVTLEVTSSDGTNSTTIVDRIIMNDDITITQQPVDVTICSNEQATFTTAATFVGDNVTYQWQALPVGGSYVDLVNASNITGATSATLNYNVSADMNGFKFRCVISKCSNSINTNEVTLTLNQAPVVDTQPITQSICEIGDAEFIVQATGTNLTYQWKYRFPNTGAFNNLADDAVFSGTNTNTLTITGVENTTLPIWVSGSPNSSATFICEVTEAGICSSNSNFAYLYKHEIPTITTDPTDVTACAASTLGVNTFFSVVPSVSNPGFYYQWQVDDGNGFVNIVDDAIYSGSNSVNLSLTGATPDLNGYLYRCEVGGCAVPVYSSAALLTIDSPPVIAVGPVQTNICTGSDATFTVEATGANLMYQWQEYTGYGSYTDISDNATYSGATTNTLQIATPTANMNNNRYKCVITSNTCTLNSSNGLLKIYTQPTLTLYSNNQTTVCDGGTTILRVAPSGSISGISAGVMSYQWQADLTGTGIFTDISDGTTYSNTNTKTLNIDTATFSLNGAKYRCVVRGCTTENVSAEETLTVLQLPLVTTSPQSQTVCSGEQVTFTAVATGSDLTYAWWRDTGDGNFTLVKAANANPDYIFTADNTFSGYKYKCIATAGNCGTTAESFEATLTVRETKITEVSSGTAGICVGGTAIFSITMSNTDGLTYQWSDGNGALSDDAVYSGVTTSTLTITAPTTAINNYSVAVSGDCGNVTYSYQLQVYGIETPVIEPILSSPANPQLQVITNFQLGVTNFEWFLNGTSYQNSGSNPIISIDQAGSYTVVASRNDCNYPESEAVMIIVTGFENSLSASKVNYYPNPVSNKLTLEMGNDFNLEKGAKISIINVNGREVFKRDYNAMQSRKTEIDMSSFESGIYLIRVINGDKMSQYKIRKQ